MEKLTLDTGVRAYALGQGVLRFNPTDPNVYARFLEAPEKLAALEKELSQAADALAPEDSQGALALLTRADREAKDVLAWVFGRDNDFDAIFGGVNLLAAGGNGERVVTNFFTALEPVLTAGAESCARQQAQAAKARAQARRAAQ